MKYYPHKFQTRFHKSLAQHRLLCAGRRGGKTVAGAVECFLQAQRDRQKFGPEERIQGGVLAPTYKMLNDVCVPELLKWGKGMIANFNKSEMKMELTDGTIILLRSADNPDSLRGLKFHWLWMEEASYTTQLVWETVAPTLADFNGRVWITTTPRGKNWVYNEFFLPAQESNGHYDAFVYTTVDNPHISHEFVKQQKDKMRPEFYRQEYEASFEEYIGQIYTGFKVKVNVMERFAIPRDWRRIGGIDIGYRHPFGAVKIALSPEDKYYVYWEYKVSDKTVIENATDIKQRNAGDLPAYWAIDPSAARKDPTSGISALGEVEAAGLQCVPANNNVMLGIDRVNQLFKEEKLFIFDDLKETIEEIINYHWDDKKTWDGEPKPYKEKDDVVDPLRYALMEYYDERTEHSPMYTQEQITKIYEKEAPRMLMNHALGLTEVVMMDEGDSTFF